MLIVDDDPCVLRAVADRCGRMGFDVKTATGGLQALIKASESQPLVLIIDVHLPELDGLSVLSYLAEAAKKSQHVIVMTGSPRERITELCGELGATCIAKGKMFWAELEARLAAICSQEMVATQPAGYLPTAALKTRPRVLLVDDDFDIRRFYFRKFAKVGAELLYAADGIGAFSMARRLEPTVIVVDYAMPNGDAEYLLTRLRSVPETANVPVVVHSGRRLPDTVKQRLQTPIDGHPGAIRILQKRADATELFAVLQRLCGFPSDLAGAPLYQ
jgi:DNA-binding response OmpR family regulator